MSIQILPARLANQIAAGEVVERPASVVKELVENSLDAGATRIDIDIEKGGTKCIRIKDNGSGVSKDQLTLALSRHATSKISHLDDLEAIVSLGFRGEALASISAVSRLTFTSKPSAQDQAWQAVAEGRDMQVSVQPAAHPQGTTVEVLDLFFNTPARRRFLKTEKTEFQHIDELVKRIALSRFDIAITLTHNNKVLRQYRAAPEQAQQEKRIAAICSEQFMQHAVFFEHNDPALKISGWISDRLSPRPLADVQYCYINGRMIRDKLINHAIRQVYAHLLPQGMFPGYIIYIECDAKEVDVNVHPAKHEVRFHQARWVHDFISSALSAVLNDNSLLINNELINEVDPTHYRVSEHAYQPPSIESARSTSSSASGSSPSGYSAGAYPKPALSDQQVDAYCDFVAEAYQQPIANNIYQRHVAPDLATGKLANVIAIIDQDYALIQPLAGQQTLSSNNGLLVMSVKQVERLLISQYLFSAWENAEVITQPLLLPVRFPLEPDMLMIAEQTRSLLNRLGFSYKQQGKFIIVSKVPARFRHSAMALILPKVFTYLSEHTAPEKEYNVAQLCDLLSELLFAHESAVFLSIAEIEQLLSSVASVPVDALQNCFSQPDLSLLLQGITPHV